MGTVFEIDPDVEKELGRMERWYVTDSRIARQRVIDGSVDDQDGNGLEHYFSQFDPKLNGMSQSGEEMPALLWGLTRRFLSPLAPAVKPFGKYVFKKAMRAGVATLKDVAQGDNWKEALKRRAGDAGDEIIDDMHGKVQKLMGGDGYGEGYGGDYDAQDYDYYNDKFKWGPSSGIKAIEYPGHHSSSGEDIKAESQRQLFSLRPPPSREGCVSALVRRRQTKKKTAGTKRRQAKKKVVGSTKRRQPAKKRKAPAKKKKDSGSQHE